MANILVIDDDEAMAESVISLFSLRGHQCSFARSRLEAEIQVNRWEDLGVPFDIVISDWDLRPYDIRTGAEICTYLRDNTAPQARYIIWSGLDRKVPEWASFYRKDSSDALFEEVEKVSTM